VQETGASFGRALETDFRQIVNTIPGLVATMKATGEVEFVNDRILQYTGWRPDMFADWRPLIHPEDLDGAVDKWLRSLDTGAPYDSTHRLLGADGKYRWFQNRGVALVDSAGCRVRWFILLTDLEDHIRAEENLRESRAFLLEAQRLSQTGSWKHDLRSGEVTFTPEVAQIFGIDTNLDSVSAQIFFERIHPDDRPAEAANYERAIATNSAHRSEYRIVLPDGTVKYLHNTGHPKRNAAGDIIAYVGTAMDVSEQWRARTKLEVALGELARATQVAMVGELSASIAHEVNQPLAAVVANANAGLRWLSADPPNLMKAREAAERILRDGKDASAIVQRVRGLFRRSAFERTAVDISQVIVEVLNLLQTETARKGIRVEMNLADGLPAVEGDRVQLQQVVLNLALNGIEAMESICDRPKTLRVSSALDRSGDVVIAVEDSGVGLASPDKMFEAFFTTKENGMGMGLAISRSIIEVHDGRLWAEPGASCGAVFRFALPVKP
jgi:PAS domain S-box-containing protein